MTVLRNSLARCNARHLRIKHLVQFIFADPIYHNALTNCAALSCRALRRVNRLCSRTVSDAANMSRHGSTLCSPTVEKFLCRSLFSERSHVGNLRQTLQGKRGDSQEGGNRRCLPSCAPARRQRTPPAAGRGESPRSAERNSPLNLSEKTAAQTGAKSRRLLTVYPLYFPVRLVTIGL